MRSFSCFLPPQRRIVARSASPAGFTLVELLVVIAIIGILIALLLPAIQAARESARLIECTNHLKQIATAMHSYLDATGHYPSGGYGVGWAPHPDRGIGVEQPGSCFYSLLPFMEHKQLFELGKGVGPMNDTSPKLLQANKQRLATPLSILHCPSRRVPKNFPVDPSIWFVHKPMLSDTLDVGCRNDYAANAGEEFYNMGHLFTRLEQAKGCHWLDPFTMGSGGEYRVTGIVWMHSQFTPKHVRDGSTHTYMVGEKYVDRLHASDGTSVGDDEGPFVSDERDVVRWATDWYYEYAPPARDHRGCPPGIQPQDPNYGRYGKGTWNFGSPHPAGFNMAMCDGSVRNINYDISEKIHRCLCNRCDGTAVSLLEL